MFWLRIAPIAVVLLSSVAAHASLDMCLKGLKELEVSRRIQESKDSSTGVETTYLANSGMIVSTYYDATTSKNRIVVHSKAGSVDVSENQASCQTNKTENVYNTITKLIDYNLSSDFYLFGKGKESAGARYPADQKIRSLVSNCRDVENEEVKGAVQRLARAKGYVDLVGSAKTERSPVKKSQ